MSGNISLRLAQASDSDFLKNLYADSRAGEFAFFDWSDAARSHFMDQQFAAQDRAYKAEFAGADHSIIQLNGFDIGRLIVNREDEVFHIIDLAIVSPYQGRGIGGYILKSILNEAQGRKLPATLSVLSTNPAIHLYRRLGFQETGISGPHISMRWNPSSDECEN